MLNAWATELAGSDVIVFNGNGVLIAPTTSDPDMLIYVVPPGSYTVCVYAVPPEAGAELAIIKERGWAVLDNGQAG